MCHNDVNDTQSYYFRTKVKRVHEEKKEKEIRVKERKGKDSRVFLIFLQGRTSLHALVITTQVLCLYALYTFIPLYQPVSLGLRQRFTHPHRHSLHKVISPISWIPTRPFDHSTSFRPSSQSRPADLIIQSVLYQSHFAITHFASPLSCKVLYTYISKQSTLPIRQQSLSDNQPSHSFIPLAGYTKGGKRDRKPAICTRGSPTSRPRPYPVLARIGSPCSPSAQRVWSSAYRLLSLHALYLQTIDAIRDPFALVRDRHHEPRPVHLVC